MGMQRKTPGHPRPEKITVNLPASLLRSRRQRNFTPAAHGEFTRKVGRLTQKLRDGEKLSAHQIAEVFVGVNPRTAKRAIHELPKLTLRQRAEVLQAIDALEARAHFDRVKRELDAQFKSAAGAKGGLIANLDTGEIGRLLAEAGQNDLRLLQGLPLTITMRDQIVQAMRQHR